MLKTFFETIISALANPKILLIGIMIGFILHAAGILSVLALFVIKMVSLLVVTVFFEDAEWADEVTAIIVGAALGAFMSLVFFVVFGWVLFSLKYVLIPAIVIVGGFVVWRVMVRKSIQG